MSCDASHTRRTAELDPSTPNLLLADPAPTALMARDQLRDLIDESCAPEIVTLAHTVPRARARDADDVDFPPRASPVAVVGVLGLLVALFLAILRL
jgi:hypothetical protein